MLTGNDCEKNVAENIVIHGPGSRPITIMINVETVKQLCNTKLQKYLNDNWKSKRYVTPYLKNCILNNIWLYHRSRSISWSMMLSYWYTFFNRKLLGNMSILRKPSENMNSLRYRKLCLSQMDRCVMAVWHAGWQVCWKRLTWRWRNNY